MFRLTAKIEITSAKKWVFDKVNSIEITRDTDTLTDTCELKLPKKILWLGENAVPLKRGDEIKVFLGYNGNLQLAFQGYITSMGFKAPFTINCEDYLFKLKQQETRKLAYKSATLDQILKDQELKIPYKVCGEQHIGPYRVTADTVSGLLGNLKEVAGVRSFIRLEEEPVLYCGVLFDPEDIHKYIFATGLNIIEDTELKEQKEEEFKIKVRAISLLPDNEKIEIEVGDEDGEVRTLHTYDKKEEELRAWAEQELKRLRRAGLSGSFTTFGGKLAEKLDYIGMRIEGESRGIYQLQKNIIRYSSEGFRQEITLGRRIAE